MSDRDDKQRAEELEDLAGKDREEHLQQDTAEDIETDSEGRRARNMADDDPVGFGHSLAPPS